MQAVRLLVAHLRDVNTAVASMVVDKTLEVLGLFFIRTCRDCHFVLEEEETKSAGTLADPCNGRVLGNTDPEPGAGAC